MSESSIYGHEIINLLELFFVHSVLSKTNNFSTDLSDL